MAEENLCSSLPDVVDAVVHQPQQDTWTSIDHQYNNGEQESIVWDDAEVQINLLHGTDQLSLSPKAGRETPGESEQWEQIIWPAHPMTCAPLSFATVQWDMPDPSTQTHSLMTDSSLANELDSSSVTRVETTSPSLAEDVNTELVIQRGGGEEDEFYSRLLDSNLEWTENGSEPCDAVDVQEPPTQEREDPTHELLDGNNEIPQKTDSGADPVEAADLINIPEESEVSGGEADSFVDLKPEEEQEEPSVTLTGQGDSVEEKTLPSGVEIEEGGEGDEQEQINVSNTGESEEAKAGSCLSTVELPTEPLQADDTGPTVNAEELIKKNLQHSESEEHTELLERLHDGPSGQTAEPEMCEDVDQNVESERPESEDDNKELPVQVADNETERIENSTQIVELTATLEETSCLEHCDRDQMLQDAESTPQPESKQLEESEQIQAELSQDSDQLGQLQHLDQSPEMELTRESTQPERADLPENSTQSEQTVYVKAEDLKALEQLEQMEPSEQNEQMLQTANLSEQLVQPETDESAITEHLSPEAEVTQQTGEAEFNQVDKQEMSGQGEEVGGAEDESVQTVVANGEQTKPLQTAVPHMNGDEVNREMARRLAQRLFELDEIQRVDVVKHLDKDNDFSRAVGEEYLKHFDFTGQTLDHALRSFLKVVVLIGETQERERVLQHFASRFHQCNPDSFSSSESVLALTCALMLLNTDLHGQNVGKVMSSSKFVSNLDGMNEEGNFSKDLLKSLYNSIRNEPLQWAIDEEELNSVLADEDAGEEALQRSRANPFQDVPHDKKASVVKQGFLQRKLHADIDGKRTPWGRRGWKTFYGVLRGMVLYLQKDDYRRDQPTDEDVVSVHHSLAEQAADYTKKPHVFRLQTADWRVFLFQASSKVEMNSWISRINLVSALHSSPPFPAAVGSQRRFCRPILPCSQSAHTLERQLQSYAGMLESFKADLSYLQQNPPEGKKAKAKELEEHRVRAEYLQHEMCRYETYIRGLEAWKSVKKTSVLSTADLNLFDKAVCADSVGEIEDDEGGLKKSHSSPSLDLEMAPLTVIKVRRNISERRTYRRAIIPRWNKEA